LHSKLTLLSRLNSENLLRDACYVLLCLHSASLKNGSFYIGYSTDLKKRFQQHNDGESQATKPFRPYKLIFYEAFLSDRDARNREEYLKGGYGRRSVQKMLNNYLKKIKS
jgi:putative endonuclease